MGRVETGKYADRRLDRYSVSQGIASGVNRAIQPGGLSPKLDSKLHCSPIKRSREAISIKIVFSRIICQFIPIDAHQRVRYLGTGYSVRPGNVREFVMTALSDP